MDGMKAIPDLFFDLIARIMPGSVAILAFSAALDLDFMEAVSRMFRSGPLSIQDPAFLIIASFLGAAYLVGHLLGPVGTFFSDKIVLWLPMSYQVLRTAVKKDQRRVTRYPALVCKFLVEELNRTIEPNAHLMKPNGKYMVTTFLWYDWLTVHAPGAGQRATKIYAEYFMCVTVLIALVSALILHMLVATRQSLLMNLHPLPLDWNLVIALCAGILLSFIATIQQFRTFQWNVIQQYYALRRELKVTTIARQRSASRGGNVIRLRGVSTSNIAKRATAGINKRKVQAP